MRFLICTLAIFSFVAHGDALAIKNFTEHHSRPTAEPIEVTTTMDNLSEVQIPQEATNSNQTISPQNATQNLNSTASHDLSIKQRPALLGQKRKNWWEGSNVCKKTNLSKAVVSTSATTFLIGNGESTVQVSGQCINTDKMYHCTVERVENGDKVTETTTYECCSGYHNSENPVYGNRCVRNRKKN